MKVNPFLAFCQVAMKHLTWEQIKARWASKIDSNMVFNIKDYPCLHEHGETIFNTTWNTQPATRYMNIDGDIIALQGDAHQMTIPQFTMNATVGTTDYFPYEINNLTIPVNDATTGDRPTNAPILRRITPMGQL